MTLIIENNRPAVVVIERRTPMILRPQYGSGVKGDRGWTPLAMSLRGTLVAGIGIQPLALPFDITVHDWIASVPAAFKPSGASIIFDIMMDGVTTFPTSPKPTILPNTNVSAPVVPDVQLIPAGSVLTVDVLQVGSIQPGANATIVGQVA